MKLKKVLCFAASVMTLTPAFATPQPPPAAFTAAQEQRTGEVAAEYLRVPPDILIEMSETQRARKADGRPENRRTGAAEADNG